MVYKLIAAVLLTITFNSFALAQNKDTPPDQRHKTSSEEIKAIEAVIMNFQTALKTKDAKLLSTLVLHSNILFSSPKKPDTIQKMRDKIDVNYDGIDVGGFTNFSKFVHSSKENIEEKFYNIKITQDDNFAVVLFDFEFIVNDVIDNYGIECWQMMKVGQNWKILSVTWSSRG